MRLFKLAAAIGLMAGSLGLTTAAQAQHHGPRIENRADYNRHVLGIGAPGDRRDRDWNRSDRRGRDWNRSDRRSDRGYERSHRRDWRRDGYRGSRDCRTVWRNDRRVRVCR